MAPTTHSGSGQSINLCFGRLMYSQLCCSETLKPWSPQDGPPLGGGEGWHTALHTHSDNCAGTRNPTCLAGCSPSFWASCPTGDPRLAWSQIIIIITIADLTRSQTRCSCGLDPLADLTRSQTRCSCGLAPLADLTRFQTRCPCGLDLLRSTCVALAFDFMFLLARRAYQCSDRPPSGSQRAAVMAPSKA